MFGPETKYNYHEKHIRYTDYWMVTKCHPEYTNMSVIQLCNNPGLNGLLDSIIPVVLVATDELFRNKFCALCNNIELTDNIIYWQLDIYADGFVKFPQRNLLSSIRSNRENIFYTSPKFVTPQEPCYIPPYTISKCNETGLWDQYDKDTELAYNSFIDPYNRTYKNLFCFKCNNRNETSQHISRYTNRCYETEYETEAPVFIAPVSRETVLGYEQHPCGTRQIYDHKLVS